MATNRNIPLDILRGAVILLMIFVDAQGIFDGLYKIFAHTEWEGISVADMVFPGFIFAMGASAYFSQKFSSKNLRNNVFWVKKILKRTIILFFFGLLFNAAPILVDFILNSAGNFYSLIEEILSNIRILGVLQRLAMVYFFASLIIRFLRGKYLLIVSFVLLLIHSILMRAYSFDNPFYMYDNLSIFIDLSLLSKDHIYISNPPFEPEGILGILPSSASMILSVYTTKLLVETKYRTLTFFATCMVFLGGVWSIFDIISKPLWSAPYSLITTGFLTYFLLLITILWNKFKDKNNVFRPFIAFGCNPIFFYIATNFMFVLLTNFRLETGESLYFKIYQIITQCAVSEEFSIMLYGIFWCLFWYPLAYFLHKYDVRFKI